MSLPLFLRGKKKKQVSQKSFLIRLKLLSHQPELCHVDTCGCQEAQETQLLSCHTVNRKNNPNIFTLKEKRYILYVCRCGFHFYDILFYFFTFWPCHAVCRILLLHSEIELRPSGVRAQSLNHWTAREVPVSIFIIKMYIMQCVCVCVCARTLNLGRIHIYKLMEDIPGRENSLTGLKF